jgi:hypothetical protein
VLGTLLPSDGADGGMVAALAVSLVTQKSNERNRFVTDCSSAERATREEHPDLDRSLQQTIRASDIGNLG